MKRFISIILCLTTVFNVMAVIATAAEFDYDVFADVAEDADEALLSTVNPMDGLVSGMSRLCMDMDKRLLVEQQMAAFNSFMTGMKTISLGLSLVNGTVSFLKLIGVLKDPVTQQLESIYDVLLDVQETVHEIDKRTEDIQKSLTTQASTTTYNFRLGRYDSAQQSWNSFFNSNGPYNEMTRLTQAYQSEVNKRMIEFTESWQSGEGCDLRAIYSEEGVPLVSGKNLGEIGKALPREPLFSDDGIEVAFSATLPADYITVAKKFVDAESYLGLLEDAIKSGTEKALADKALTVTDESFYETYEAMDDSEKAEVKDSLSQQLLDAVVYDTAYEAANMTYDVGSFANAVNSAYKAFSDTVLGANSVTSPLESGLSKLSFTHAFEGEIKDEAAAICSYITEISVAFGEFTSFLVSMDKGFTEKDRDKVSKTTITTAYYPICYHDSFMTGYDNYCYPLNALIGYNRISYKGGFRYDDDSLDDPEEKPWELVSETPFVTTDEIKEVMNSNRMLSDQDMTLLYLYYQAAASKDPELTEFNEYLYLSGMMPPKTYEVTERTLFGKTETRTKTFKPSAQYLTSVPSNYDLMKRKVGEYRTRDKTWGDTIQFYKNIVRLRSGVDIDYSREGESCVFFHDLMRANVYDTSPAGGSLENRMKENKTLVERAYTYYVLGSDYGAGKYVYVVFADPDASTGYGFNGYSDKHFRASSYTVYGAKYSMLYYSNVNARESRTASMIGSGNWYIIGGCALALTGGIVAAALIYRKTKKKKLAEPVSTVEEN